jgi:two-component system KDP operon response regulator KdpE
MQAIKRLNRDRLMCVNCERTTLIKHAGKVITHRQLLKEVWGPDSVFETHYLRVDMAQLRRKVEANPAQPRFLLTEPGIGYRRASP